MAKGKMAAYEKMDKAMEKKMGIKEKSMRGKNNLRRLLSP